MGLIINRESPLLLKDLCHDQEIPYHGVVGRRVRTGGPVHPEQGLAHHRPTTLLLFETEGVDHVEDVAGHGEAKVDALLAHESQFETTMGIDEGDDGTQREAFRRRILDELAQTCVFALDQGLLADDPVQHQEPDDRERDQRQQHRHQSPLKHPLQQVAVTPVQLAEQAVRPGDQGGDGRPATGAQLLAEGAVRRELRGQRLGKPTADVECVHLRKLRVADR